MKAKLVNRFVQEDLDNTPPDQTVSGRLFLELENGKKFEVVSMAQVRRLKHVLNLEIENDTQKKI